MSTRDNAVEMLLILASYDGDPTISSIQAQGGYSNDAATLAAHAFLAIPLADSEGGMWENGEMFAEAAALLESGWEPGDQLELMHAIVWRESIPVVEETDVLTTMTDNEIECASIVDDID